MPSRQLVQYIQSVTHADDRGQLFFRDRNGSWRRLRTEQDYKALNALVDAEREAFNVEQTA